MPKARLPILTALAILWLSPTASAEHWDVIQSKLTDGCTMQKYMAIVKDFNAYYQDKGYQAEILVPLHAEEQGSFFWIGRSASASAFGKAYDHWVMELPKEGSTVSQLSTRFQDCSDLVSRQSYMHP